MKITKPGDPARIDPLWVATCSKCGCEMEAKESELSIETDMRGDSYSKTVNCLSECGNTVHFYKKR